MGLMAGCLTFLQGRQAWLMVLCRQGLTMERDNIWFALHLLSLALLGPG
jgi:hypothetical protein